MSELSCRYAKALWPIMPDRAVLEETAGVLMGTQPLWEALCSPAVQAREKARVLERLPALDGHAVLKHFYCLLAEKGRMALLPQILEDVRDLELAEHNTARCVLTSARPLGQEELEKLRAALCRLHGRDNVVFTTRVNPALLGGFTLEIEGVTYDKSAQGALRRLKQRLEERQMA